PPSTPAAAHSTCAQRADGAECTKRTPLVWGVPDRTMFMGTSLGAPSPAFSGGTSMPLWPIFPAATRRSPRSVRLTHIGHARRAQEVDDPRVVLPRLHDRETVVRDVAQQVGLHAIGGS